MFIDIQNTIITSLAILIVLFAISGYGLKGGVKKTHRILCVLVFILAIAYAIYSVGYAGEQGAIGLIFIPFGIGASCLVITIILWLVQLFQKRNND